MRRFEEALEAAAQLREIASPDDGLSAGLAEVAGRLAEEDDAVAVDGVISGLPLRTHYQASSLLALFQEAEARRDKAGGRLRE